MSFRQRSLTPGGAKTDRADLAGGKWRTDWVPVGNTLMRLLLPVAGAMSMLPALPSSLPVYPGVFFTGIEWCMVGADVTGCSG